ncbi:MAG: NUDIX domain-containing protein [Patescibacteria group bacterium]|jgi:8-oxo-dGTP pyrophosphatase MutT (NUDIX family)|nr:NUDIX domain-containing protein [Patescibacteria group bacterium]
MVKITCHNHEGILRDFDSSELTFRPSVYGILIKDNKVLLSKQWDGYDFPGGGVNIDETLEQTLKREFFEETGLQVEPGKIVHAQTSFFFTRSGKRPYNAVVIYFLCQQVGGKLSIDNLDIYEKGYVGMPEWLDIEDLDKFKYYNPVDSPALIREALKIKNQQ